MAEPAGYKKELIVLSACAAIFAFAVLLLPKDHLTGLVAGYILGLAAAAMHFFSVWYTRSMEYTRFIGKFYLAILLRFLLVLTLFTALILMTDIERLSFTLSFIISYIFHSVMDIIWINKTFADRPSSNS